MTEPLPIPASELPDPRAELTERWEAIETMAAFVAEEDCAICDGEGVEWEGSEWTLCQCVLMKVEPNREDHSDV